MVWKKLSETEVTLSKRWYLEEGLSAVQMAKRLGRSPSTISRLVIKRRPLKVQGRKPLLNKRKVDKLVATAEAMIQKADSEREVTVSMIKRASRCKAGTRTIQAWQMGTESTVGLLCLAVTIHVLPVCVCVCM